MFKFYYLIEIFILLGIFFICCCCILINKKKTSFKFSQIVGCAVLFFSFIFNLYYFFNFENSSFFLSNIFFNSQHGVILLRSFFLFFGFVSIVTLPFLGVDKQWEIIVIILTLIFGFSILLTTNNLVYIFLCFEIISICIYILIFMQSYKRKLVDSGLEYFILSALSNLFFLFGVSLIFVFYPTIFLEEIQFLILSNIFVSPFFVFSVTFLLIMFGFKFGIIPFYNWLPALYDGFSFFTLIFLMVPLKIIYFIVFIKLITGAFVSFFFFFSPIFFLFGFSTLIIGIFGALYATKMKVLFGYASMFHSGVLLLLLSIFGTEVNFFLMIYLIIYGSITLVVFVFFCFLFARTFDQNFIYNFESFLLNNPRMSWFFFLVLFGIAGLPPLLGFLMKINVILSFIKNGYICITVFFISISTISNYYYLKVIKYQKFNGYLTSINYKESYSFRLAWFFFFFFFNTTCRYV